MDQKFSSIISVAFLAFIIALLLHSPSEAEVSGDAGGSETVIVAEAET